MEETIESINTRLPSVMHDHEYLAKPQHVQRLENALNLNSFLTYIENCNDRSNSESESSSSDDFEFIQNNENGTKTYSNGLAVGKVERQMDKIRLYNFNKMDEDREVLQDMLLTDTSSDDNEDEWNIDKVKRLIKMRKFALKHRQKVISGRAKNTKRYKYFTTGLLSFNDGYTGDGTNTFDIKSLREKRTLERKRAMKKKRLIENEVEEGEIRMSMPVAVFGNTQKQAIPVRSGKSKKLTETERAVMRRKTISIVTKKEIPRAAKQFINQRKENLQILKKLAQGCMRERRKMALASQKLGKDVGMRARRLAREMNVFWKRFDKVEKGARKKAEKEALEQRKIDIELREAKRHERKLNFLITQTELYAHFMANKNRIKSSSDIINESDETEKEILSRLDDIDIQGKSEIDVSKNIVQSFLSDDYDSSLVKDRALKNVEEAVNKQNNKTKCFDEQRRVLAGNDSALSSPVFSDEYKQPTLFEGTLKSYQLKGMNWLMSLYDQGINGILADEMGLGKTVQAIATLGLLCESQGTWGPFLVVAPASTLHNWQQECVRFVPRLKVVPYWGTTQDRKILRTFWNSAKLYTADASFHIVITSYQIVIQDVKYFQRIKWQYMILDEAQAIKSTTSTRWKMLLQFNCRNRLLLTGTPIQNSMAELWALLHFIMPTLFDSHDEFNEWFSKDIENHAEKQSGIDESQLSRLHMILKPFMLRRVKKDVENELSDKIEVLTYCPITSRQRKLYSAVKKKIKIEDLLQSSASLSQSSTSSLMNLVMQFRKVCNHPELFERRELKSSFFMKLSPYFIPKLIYNEGILNKSWNNNKQLLLNRLTIFIERNITNSIFCKNEKPYRCFSFSRFINLCATDLYKIFFYGFLERWSNIIDCNDEDEILSYWSIWKINMPMSYYMFRLEPLNVLYPTYTKTSPILKKLCFTSSILPILGHTAPVLYYMKETVSHRKIRLKNSNIRNQKSSKSHYSIHDDDELIFPHIHNDPKILPEEIVYIPSFLYKAIPKVVAECCGQYCIDTNFMNNERASLFDFNIYNIIMYGSRNIFKKLSNNIKYFTPMEAYGLSIIKPIHGYSYVYVPGKETLITDSGKLGVLDNLLAKLKLENHRVLLYSQMTRMIDLLEEYMWHRKHTYVRLDGSSKISDRRDMVADFQSRSDIFVFLLSTRAGGVGINLTAADTVIFYDSDWNPTVDQQAMDRAHRPGQTKQVTVYRLICEGTIEERILQRAKEKSEIQRMVIQGGNFKPDTLKPKEVVSLLLDDEEIEKKLNSSTEPHSFSEKQMFSKSQLNNDFDKKREALHKKIVVSNNKRKKRGRPSKQPKFQNGIATWKRNSRDLKNNQITSAASVDTVNELQLNLKRKSNLKRKVKIEDFNDNSEIKNKKKNNINIEKHKHEKNTGSEITLQKTINSNSLKSNSISKKSKSMKNRHVIIFDHNNKNN